MNIYLKFTLQWCCLFSNFTKFVILESLSIVDLALSGVEKHAQYFGSVSFSSSLGGG